MIRTTCLPAGRLAARAGACVPAGSLAAFSVAGPARAHGTLADSADFYAGMVHPFLASEHLMLLAGAGLLLGRPPGQGVIALLALVAGLAGGLAFAPALGDGARFVAPILLGLALLTGGLLAADLGLPVWARVGLGVVAGALIGADTDVAMGAADDPMLAVAPYAGVVAGALLITVNLMALSSLATATPWTTGIRVAGSWIAAAAFMVLVVTLAPPIVPA